LTEIDSHQCKYGVRDMRDMIDFHSRLPFLCRSRWLRLRLRALTEAGYRSALQRCEIPSALAHPVLSGLRLMLYLGVEFRADENDDDGKPCPDHR
jgi:hypothetical protein